MCRGFGGDYAVLCLLCCGKPVCLQTQPHSFQQSHLHKALHLRLSAAFSFVGPACEHVGKPALSTRMLSLVPNQSSDRTKCRKKSSKKKKKSKKDKRKKKKKGRVYSTSCRDLQCSTIALAGWIWALEVCVTLADQDESSDAASALAKIYSIWLVLSREWENDLSL